MKAPLPSPLGDDTPIIPLGLHVSSDAATISYRSSFWGEWRNNLLFNFLHPSALGLMLLAATAFSLLSNHVFLLGIIRSFPLRWVCNFAFLQIVNAIVGVVNILNARDARRGETMTLRRDELEYTSPVKTRHISWRNVKLVLDATGYLYFVRLDGVTYVPHAAFPTPAAKQSFLEAARTLQRSRGAIWPTDSIAQMLRQTENDRT